jgi:Tol biopolymer transport system component
MTELNSNAREWRGVFFSDFLRIMWSSERIDVGSSGGFDIWEASRASTADNFSNIRPVTSLNTVDPESNATVSNDGLVVYFRRDLGGQADIFRASRTTIDEPFTNIEPVTELNTSADESDPWLSRDQRTIFFASNRSGAEHIYQATR